MRRRFIICALLILTAGALTGGAGDGANIRVFVSGFKNDRGQAAALLFRAPDGFPAEPAKAYRKVLAPIKNGRADLVFTGVPRGRWAVSALHDENKNQKMDKSFWGYPTEGFAASGRMRSFMRPPEFKDSAFDVKSTETLKLRLRIKYVFD